MVGTQFSFQHIGTLASLPCWALFGPKRAFLDPPCTSLKNGNGQNCFKPTSYMSEGNACATDSKSKHIYGRDNQNSDGKGSKIAKNGKILAQNWHRRYFLSIISLSCVTSLVPPGYQGLPNTTTLS